MYCEEKQEWKKRMKNNPIKRYAKDSMTLVGTGIGLSVGAGVIGAVGGNAGIINPLSKGIGMVAPLVGMQAGIGIISDLKKKYSKKY